VGGQRKGKGKGRGSRLWHRGSSRRLHLWEAIFFSYTIVDGYERWQRGTSHRDAFCLLDDDVAKLENIVFKQNLDGVEDGRSTGVQAKFVGDMDVIEITLECHEAVLGVDIGIHANGVHRKDSDGWW
jgi:hypothetical protein